MFKWHFVNFDPGNRLLDLKIVQFDANFIEIGWEMTKLENPDLHGKLQFAPFSAHHNFCISQPILMKLASNCTILRSRSRFPGSKFTKCHLNIKIRRYFVLKSGFLGKTNFPDLPRTGSGIWEPHRTQKRYCLNLLNSNLISGLQARCESKEEINTLQPFLV